MKKTVLLIAIITLFPKIVCAQDVWPVYFLKISISECKMWLYRVTNDATLDLVREYKVATVKKTEKKYPLGRGIVTKVEFKPAWYPTERTRKEFVKKGMILPEIIPSGHKLNYMGSFKIHLSHTVPGKGEVFRIHGSRKEDERKIGTRVSGGCIRMLNSEGEELAKIIPPGTEVEIVL